MLWIGQLPVLVAYALEHAGQQMENIEHFLKRRSTTMSSFQVYAVAPSTSLSPFAAEVCSRIAAVHALPEP